MRHDTGAVAGSSTRVLADRYRLVAYLGGGGMADVYRAVDTRLGRPVAVKVFRSGTDATGRQRFEDEARLLARLDHPGLVTVHDAGTSDGELFLAMQLVEGHTLAERIADGPIPAAQTVELGRELATVLAYVHSCGIVHRDVKPANVLIAAAGRVFLADFGVSQLVDAAGQMTATGIAVGTAAYMAPEQATGTETGPAIDVYALGLVLLECATGRPEYTGNGIETAMTRLTRPPHVPPALPSQLAETLHAMLAAEPRQRPTAAQCVALLGGTTTPASGAASALATLSADAADSPTSPGTRFIPPGDFTKPLTRVAARQREPSRLTRHGRALLAIALAALVVLGTVLLRLSNDSSPTSPSPTPPASTVTPPPATPSLTAEQQQQQGNSNNQDGKH
jgi:serine/threonine protein kinase